MRIALVSSSYRCGIQTYSHTLAAAFRALGHEVDYVGVGKWDSRDLLRKVRAIPRATDLVVIEHEFGIFRNSALVLAMGLLRLRRIPVLLSLHELEPDKFHHYTRLYQALHYRQRGGCLFELARAPYAAALVAQRLLRYRLTLWALGLFPERIVVHSGKAMENVTLITSDLSRVRQVPHFVEPLEGIQGPVEGEAKRALRRELGLPEEGLVLVSPGFLFKRKRLIEVARATPADATMVIAGTGVSWEAEHPAEIRAVIEREGLRNVILDEDYDRMPRHLAAADAVVLYYKDIFQSGIASHAVWAEKPLLLSDIPSFRMYEGAALYAGDDAELRERMRELADPALRERLAGQARALKERLSPEAMARLYLETPADARTAP